MPVAIIGKKQGVEMKDRVTLTTRSQMQRGVVAAIRMSVKRLVLAVDTMELSQGTAEALYNWYTYEFYFLLKTWLKVEGEMQMANTVDGAESHSLAAVSSATTACSADESLEETLREFRITLGEIVDAERLGFQRRSAAHFQRFQRQLAGFSAFLDQRLEQSLEQGEGEGLDKQLRKHYLSCTHTSAQLLPCINDALAGMGEEPIKIWSPRWKLLAPLWQKRYETVNQGVILSLAHGPLPPRLRTQEIRKTDSDRNSQVELRVERDLMEKRWARVTL